MKTLTLIALIALPALPTVAVAQPVAPAGIDDYPVMETVLPTEGIHAYLAKAEAFIKAHPDSPLVPRVYLDMLIIASLRNNTQTAKELKAKLLFEHGSAPAAMFVVTTFADGEAARKFINEAVDDRLSKLEPVSPTGLMSAVRTSVKRHGQKMLDELTFALLVAAAAEQAGDDLHGPLLQALRRRQVDDPSYSKTLETFAINPSRLGDRLVALHALREYGPARKLLRYYSAQLAGQKDAPTPVMRVLAEACLDAKQFERAVVILDKLLAQQGEGDHAAAWQYWRGWALSVQGESEAALAAWAKLAKADPDSPWAKSAATLADCVRHRDERYERLGGALARVFQRLRTDAGQLEINLTYQPADQPAYRVYLGYSSAKQVQAQLKSAGKTLIAYRVIDDQTQVYLASQEVTHVFPGVRSAPFPKFNLSQGEDGSINFAFNLQMMQLENVGAGLSDILASPLLTPDRLTAALKRSARGGGHPGPITQQDDAATFRWVRPGLKPELDIVEVTISKDDKITGVRTGNAHLTSLRYGAAGSFPLSAPAWPQGPTRQHDKMDGTIFFQLIAELGRVFQKAKKS